MQSENNKIEAGLEFTEFPKLARLTRECTITEKLDGTNASICIVELDGYPADSNCIWQADGLAVYAGSRTRWITPTQDNYGFARWALENIDELLKLGVGHHFGEWWGAGIQRRYGLTEKRFSLFNTKRWADDDARPACCHVVPVLYSGMFTTDAVDACLEQLEKQGSVAAPGFMKPEGVVVWHDAARVSFKKTLGGDGHKGQGG